MTEHANSRAGDPAAAAHVLRENDADRTRPDRCPQVYDVDGLPFPAAALADLGCASPRKLERLAPNGRALGGAGGMTARAVLNRTTKAKEPDKFGNEQWEIYLAEPEPKDGQRDVPRRGQGSGDRTREHDLPAGETRVIKNERRGPREEHIRELSSRLEPDTEIPI